MKTWSRVLAVLLIAVSARVCAADPASCCGSASHAKSAARCEKRARASDVTAATRGPAAAAKRCSAPYAAPGDVGAAVPSSAARADAVPAACAGRASAPAAKLAPQSAKEPSDAPAFGPLFLAHQALML